MRTRTIIALVIICALAVPAVGQLIPNLGGQRAGISGLQFMKIGVGARGAGMGEAMVAVANDASALFWNPAGLTLVSSNSVLLSHSEWLVGLKHDFAGIVYHLTTDDIVGLSVISLATDDMRVTTETQPEGNGKFFKYSDIAIGGTYARKMTSQFSFGLTARYVQEDLDVVKIRTVIFDLGTYYAMGLGSTRIAVAVSNFGSDAAPTGEFFLMNGTLVNDFQAFSPPTVFKVGIAMEALQTESERITLSMQLNHPNDNAENVRIGVEAAFQEWFFVRAGIKRTIGEQLLGVDTKSADDLSLGVGLFAPVGISDVTFDYSYTHFNQLGAVHRISFAFTY